MAVSVRWTDPNCLPDLIDAILAGADSADEVTARRWRKYADELGDALDDSDACGPSRRRRQRLQMIATRPRETPTALAILP
jgi:hypothetical protein